MSWNSFGRVLRFTTWGESHGPAIGAVVDGCPPGIALTEGDIQPWLDKRRPGTSRFTTQRREPDAVRILSGVYEGRTTGTPISLMIDNVDQRSKDYSEVAQAYRPGHADYAYDAKYGFRDPRGGGRSSARETAMRVAAGAVARLVIPDVRIRAWVEAIGGDRIETFDDASIDANPFFCPDPVAAARWEVLVDAARKAACRKHRFAGTPRLTELLAAMPDSHRARLTPLMRAKPVRSASGIAVVAVMSKPHRCPHISLTGNVCVYCPGGPDSDFEYSTQSYTGYEVSR